MTIEMYIPAPDYEYGILPEWNHRIQFNKPKHPGIYRNNIAYKKNRYVVSVTRYNGRVKYMGSTATLDEAVAIYNMYNHKLNPNYKVFAFNPTTTEPTPDSDSLPLPEVSTPEPEPFYAHTSTSEMKPFVLAPEPAPISTPLLKSEHVNFAPEPPIVIEDSASFTESMFHDIKVSVNPDPLPILELRTKAMLNYDPIPTHDLELIEPAPTPVAPAPNTFAQGYATIKQYPYETLDHWANYLTYHYSELPDYEGDYNPSLDYDGIICKELVDEFQYLRARILQYPYTVDPLHGRIEISFLKYLQDIHKVKILYNFIPDKNDVFTKIPYEGTGTVAYVLDTFLRHAKLWHEQEPKLKHLEPAKLKSEVLPPAPTNVAIAKDKSAYEQARLEWKNAVTAKKLAIIEMDNEISRLSQVVRNLK
jgi:hypothetical protein